MPNRQDARRPTKCLSKAALDRVLALAALLAVAGCADSLVSTPGFDTEELTTVVGVSSDSINTYIDEIQFSVIVFDPANQSVTNFEDIQVERRPVGGGLWIGIPTVLDLPPTYVASHVFEEPGEYDIRVRGIRPSDEEAKVLFESIEPLRVVPARTIVNDYLIQAEPSPGSLTEGATVLIQFVVDDVGTGVPAGGLAPTLWVEENGGERSEYAANEDPLGFYRAEHTFSDTGTATLGITFDGPGDEETEWSFEAEVHDAG